ncbi:MAG: DNA-methyltransferase [Rhodospirillales bacterium]
MWTGDNLPIMRGINSDCADLIYLDPPLNGAYLPGKLTVQSIETVFKDVWMPDDVDFCEHGEVAEYSPAAHAVIQAARHAHSKLMRDYLVFIAVRLLETRRLLKPTGSIYLHCDPTSGHFLKLLMDAIFGATNFQNEIIWKRTAVRGREKPRNQAHDTILFYTHGEDFTWNSKVAIQDVITDVHPVKPVSKERTRYPTQKPLGLLERIIEASSNKGDMVFDPFCGSATTLVAADKLQRQWAGVDLSLASVGLVKERIEKSHGQKGDIIALSKIPQRTNVKKLPHYRTRKQEIFGRQRGICANCEMEFQFKAMKLHRISPQSQRANIKNMELLCAHCSRSSSN